MNEIHVVVIGGIIAKNAAQSRWVNADGGVFIAGNGPEGNVFVLQNAGYERGQPSLALRIVKMGVGDDVGQPGVLKEGLFADRDLVVVRVGHGLRGVHRAILGAEIVLAHDGHSCADAADG